MLHQCILEVYGQDISVEALADSFYYTYRLRRLFMHLFKQFILAEDIAVRGQQADRIMRLERLVQRFLRIGNNPEIGQFLFAAGH